MWFPFNGRANSSTRCEIAAAIVTTCSKQAAHAGIDNLAVVKTGTRIIKHDEERAKAKLFDNEGAMNLGGHISELHRETPFRRPWDLLKD